MMKRSARKQSMHHALCSIAAVIGIVVLPLTAHAQTTATIVGTVADPSGAVLIGVSIVATNESTGYQRTAVSRDDGSYLLDLLPLGTYRLEGEFQGFKRTVRKGITLTVGENARVDLSMEVGEVSESVTVQSTAQGVETRRGSMAHLMDQTRITELPLVNRNPQQLISLVPGASSVSTPETGPRDVAVTINGGTSTMNSFELDGVQFNSVQSNQGLPAPPPDMVQEFRVETNSYDATKGRGAAGTFNTVTRTGTNTFHGSGFQFHRNDALNARNYFALAPPLLVYNQFGGSLGGPIVKNRAFFFVGYQGTRVREEVTFATAFPPTAAERAGDFSNSARIPRDPETGQLFLNGIIPAARIDPAARKILDLLPLPNTPDGRYVYNEPQNSQINQYMGRIDYQLTPSDLLIGRAWVDVSGRERGWGNLPWTRFNEPYNVRNLVVQEMHTFSNTMINEFKVAHNLRDDSRLYLTDVTPQQLGINLPALIDPFPPQVVVSGRFNLTVNGQGRPRYEKTWSAKDILTWYRGSHVLKTGFELEKIQFLGSLNLDNGRFGFDGSATGVALGDLLLGSASTLNLLREREDHYTWSLSGFVQDDYTITSRLTLNLGLRYQYEKPIYQAQGESSTFIPGAVSPKFPTAPAGMAFAGDPGMPEKSAFFPDGNNLAPRLGFAWDVFGDASTSLRGGYGVFYQINNQSSVQFTSLNQPFSPTVNLFGVKLSDPFSTVKLPDLVPGDPIANYNPATGAAVFTLPVPMFGIDPHIRNGHVQQYSLSLQRQLPAEFLVELSYVGNTASGLPTSREANPAVCVQLPCTLANRQARRIYNPQQLGSIAYVDDIGTTSYNSLQAVLRKRFGNNSQLNANYTWSRAMATLGPFQDPLNPAADKGVSNSDRRHLFSASYVWNMPEFKNQPRVLSALVGGWELAGIVRLTSGSPFTVVSGLDNSLSLVGQDRPNLVGDPHLSSSRPRGEMIAQYFNTAAFAANAQLTFGNAGRNILTGPGFANVDLAIIKNITVRGPHTLQIRGEFFNLLNRTNFGNPVASLTSSSFGRILSASDPRRIQLGLKYRF